MARNRERIILIAYEFKTILNCSIRLNNKKILKKFQYKNNNNFNLNKNYNYTQDSLHIIYIYYVHFTITIKTMKKTIF